jgi:hypothetical protein
VGSASTMHPGTLQLVESALRVSNRDVGVSTEVLN